MRDGSVRRLVIAALLCATTAACGAAAPRPASPPTAADLVDGKQLYDTNGCAVCHGRFGQGDGSLAASLRPRPRDFRKVTDFKTPRTVEAVGDLIERGLVATPTPMPAYKHLDLETRRLLAAYVLWLGTPPEPAGLNR
jgi:mono/diheme cytochrome c family protein